MKKLVLMTLLIGLAVSLILAGGCAKPAPAPVPAPTESPAAVEEQAAPAPEKVFELKFNDWGAAVRDVGQIYERAAEMVEEQTEGRVKVTPYFSASLLQYPDTYTGLSSGVADISLYVIGATPGVHDLNGIFLQPQIGAPFFDKTSKIYEELLEKYPAIQNEMEKTNTRWLSIRAMPPYQLHTLNKPVRVPEDIKGMKIVSSGEYANLVNSLNGAAVALGPPDWYTSLERGVAEGQFVHWPAIYAYKTTELLKYHTNFGEGGTGMVAQGFIVNLDTWNSLPPDIQEILVEVYQWANDEAVKTDVALVQKAMNEAKDAGHTFVDLTPEDIQLWEEKMLPFVEKWISATENKGFPAREVYEGLQQLYKEYR